MGRDSEATLSDETCISLSLLRVCASDF